MKADLKSIAKEIRKKLIGMHRKGPHIGSAMSIVDILTVLYFDIMDISSPGDPERDRFILSKGHAVSALYVILAKKGFIKESLLEEYLTNKNVLYGHPVRGSVAGIEASTGSLGHGLPIGVGMAIAAKHDRRKTNIYVVMGDGECQEGSVWEAAILASRLKLDNIIAIIDANNLQGYEIVDDIQPTSSLKSKWESFGWNVKEADGHDQDKLKGIFKKLHTEPGKPHLIIAHTVKGKGVAEMENKLEWHYFSVPENKAEAFMDEIDRGK